MSVVFRDPAQGGLGENFERENREEKGRVER